jgi:hypothetical protein
MTIRRTMMACSLLLLSFAGLGCGSSTLETGYKPRPLGASDVERRAFYSPKYTRAAAQAGQGSDHDAEFRSRRPDYRPGF